MYVATGVSATTQLVEGAVIINQIKDSKFFMISSYYSNYGCEIVYLYCFTLTEENTPDMRDLHHYIITTYAPDWKDIGLQLNLKTATLEIFATDNPLNCTACFKKTLDMWLKSTPHATWRMLEVAITNVRRAQLGLDPITDVYGESIAISNMVLRLLLLIGHS